RDVVAARPRGAAGQRRQYPRAGERPADAPGPHLGPGRDFSAAARRPVGAGASGTVPEAGPLAAGARPDTRGPIRSGTVAGQSAELPTAGVAAGAGRARPAGGAAAGSPGGVRD